MAKDGESSSGAKPWYWVAGGIAAAAFLGALGTQAFGWISDAVKSNVDTPFNANLSEFTDKCEMFVIDESLMANLPVDEAGQFDEKWILDNGGLQAPPRLLKLSLVGDQDATVVIEAISLEDVTEYPVPDTPVLMMECPPRGGDLADRTITFNFETGVAEISNGDGNVASSLTIGAGAEPEVLFFSTPDIDDATTGCFCTWKMNVAWTSASRDGKLIVDLDGRPVSLVSVDPSWPVWAYVDGVFTQY